MRLAAHSLSYAYPRGRQLFSNLSFQLDHHERVGICAPSGSGKTTLCKLLAGYEKPTAGQIDWEGQSIDSYKGYHPVQMIWQHPELVINPRLRMREVLADSNHIPQHVLDNLGIQPAWLNRFPSQLSGGELQRFNIARAFDPRTRFIIADEITTMMDLVTQAQIWHFLIQEVQSRDIGLLAVSHSPALLEQICGRIIEIGS